MIAPALSPGAAASATPLPKRRVRLRKRSR